jgi:hypothetical protein
MKQPNQAGFAAIEALLIVVILAIIGGTGYFVWHARQSTNDSLDKAAQSTQVVETKKSTNPTKSSSSDETSQWYLYEAPSKAYTVRLADGWKLHRYLQDNSIYTFDSADLSPKPGTKATITQTDGGRDGSAVGFFLSYYADGSPVSQQGTQQSNITTNDGLQVSVYKQTQTTQEEGIGGLPVGATGYTYLLAPKQGPTVLISYGYNKGDIDIHNTVEKVVKTFHFEAVGP